jgi:adenylosuccinate synthase
MKRVGRRAKSILASEAETLRPFLRDVPLLARKLASSNKRIIVEGTQGFGLSVLHSRDYPNVTTRDTSAAGALSEAGLSPLDVEDIVLVLRAFPIRVAGNSGPFHAEELTWEQLTKEGGHTEPLHERTSVTGKTRRVARFDPGVVRQAIAVNRPTTVVLNHVDYVDTTSTASSLSPRAVGFVGWVESEIGTRVDLIGLGPDVLLPRGAALGRVAAA